MKFSLLLLSALFFYREDVEALQLTENFLSTSNEDVSATTAVWNKAQGSLHPPLVVDKTSFNGVDDEDILLDVGDGSDGVFDITTYGKFSVGGVTPGNVITIDTASHSFLQFTNFTLSPGWTILGQGPNPLWFKVQGSFTNSGLIDCSGGAGAAVTSDISGPASGGVGTCGGGNGGNGGFGGGSPLPGQIGTSGGSDATNTPGGGAPNTNAAGVFAKGGGGGGGANSSGASTNGGPAGGGGALGICTNDNYVSKFGAAVGGPGGGSGGGGGGAYLFSDANLSRGGGGGAGGGVIRITAVGNFVNSGTILARGGDGGSPSSPLGAGSGGQGGGGTVWILTAGSFTDNGTIDARHGLGGTVNGGNGTGGLGCEGRTWFTSNNGVLSGAPVLEAPSTNLPDIGEIHYSKVSAYQAQTLSYDLRNTFPTPTSLNLLTALPGASTAGILVAGSTDGFKSDNSGFLPVSSLTSLKGKRYLKFQMQLQLTTPAGQARSPASISNVTLLYDGIKKDDFPFTPACGFIGTPGEFIFWLSFFGLIWMTQPYQRAPKRRRPLASNQ